MHLVKAKRNLEGQDEREFDMKRERYLERQRHVENAKNTVVDTKGNPLCIDELPDGTCINRFPKSNNVVEDEENTSIKSAEYIGSFSVVGTEQAVRAEFVRKQLEQMREATRRKPVSLRISLSGIKVYTLDGQNTCMAHALKRISYATCDPEYRQFSFLAREPKGPVDSQYCHAFITQTPDEAEQLNTVVGNAFKLAYAELRDSRRLTFHEMIEQQIEEQKQRFSVYQERNNRDLDRRLSAISTTTISERAQVRKQRQQEVMERERAVGNNKAWAKHMVHKAKHSDPVMSSPPSGKVPSPVNGVSGKSSMTKGSGNSPQRVAAKDKHTPIEVIANMNTFEYPSNGNRPYGSPVTALKDTIDRQFNGNRPYGSPVTALKDTIDRQFNNNAKLPPAPPAQEPENYLYPISHRKSPQKHKEHHGRVPSAIQSENASQKDMIQRPLPTIPNGETVSIDCSRSRSSWSSEGQRSRGSWCSEGQRSRSSWSSDDQRSRESWASTGSMSPPPSNSQTNGGLHHSNHVHVDADGSSYMCGGGIPTATTSRYDSLRRLELQQANFSNEVECLKVAPWYQAAIPREVALELLQPEDIGAFIVRDSSSHPSCFALSVKVPKFDNPVGISHYLIYRTNKGFKMRGLEKEWSSLSALVVHHTVMSELLPCTLRLPSKHSKNPNFTDKEKEEKEEDPDYQKLTDCSTMMAALKLEM